MFLITRLIAFSTGSRLAREPTQTPVPAVAAHLRVPPDTLCLTCAVASAWTGHASSLGRSPMFAVSLTLRLDGHPLMLPMIHGHPNEPEDSLHVADTHESRLARMCIVLRRCEPDGVCVQEDLTVWGDVGVYGGTVK